MNIWDFLFVMFATGWILGVIEAWNKRVFFAVFLILMVLGVAIKIYKVTYGVESSSDFEWWQWLIGAIAFIFGIKTGKFFYEDYWKRR